MALVLVTGARGFIGRHLAACLADQDHQVVGVGHGEWAEAEYRARGISTWLNADISFEALDQLLVECGSPEQVFHLAGGSSVGAAIENPREDFIRTVDSTSILLEWLRREAPASSIVAVSSAAVYGAGHAERISEKAKCLPFSAYGTHKLMMETLCQSYALNYGLRVSIPRLYSVYGSGLKKQLLWDLCGKFMSSGKVELGGSGDELRDWSHVEDVVRGLAQAASVADSSGRVFNLATGIATSVRSIATIVAEQWGGNEAAARLSFSGKARAGDPFSLVADTSVMSSLGIECSRPVSEGIAEYVAWFREFNHPDR